MTTWQAYLLIVHLSWPRESSYCGDTCTLQRNGVLERLNRLAVAERILQIHESYPVHQTQGIAEKDRFMWGMNIKPVEEALAMRVNGGRSEK